MAFNISIQHDLNKLKRGLTALELQALPQTTVRTLNRVAESARVLFHLPACNDGAGYGVEQQSGQ